MPLIARLGLIAAVAVLGIGVLYVGIGGLGTVVGGLGSTLGGFVTNVTATPSPRPTIASVSDPPTLEQPSEPYTSEATVDLVVAVPAALVGDPAYRLRVYLTLPKQQPAPIEEVQLSEIARTIIPVELTKGINDFTVTLVGPGGVESAPSAVVRYVQDATPPKITITSPKDGALVNRTLVEIKGKTQARTTLVARNAANGSSITATALSDGTFSLKLAITTGANKITINATDPAGNATSAVINVRRGSGKLTVALGASAYQIKRTRLPEPVTLFATVTDPDGSALAGASVTFTLAIPGIGPVTWDTKTNTSGKASFQTTIPKGADLGQGSATVLVSSDEFGSTEDYTVITIVK